LEGKESPLTVLTWTPGPTNINPATGIPRLNLKGAGHGKPKIVRSHQARGIWHFDRVFRGTRIRGSSGIGDLLKELDSFIGDLALRQVHMGSLQVFIAERKADGVKTSTINGALAITRRILKLASEEWMDDRGITWLVTVPELGTCSSFRATRNGRITTRYSRAELSSLIAAAESVCPADSHNLPTVTLLRRKSG
jgi:hypothetical protein